MKLNDHIKKIHFIGIGGISMSGLAEIMHHNGYIITGSDQNESSTVDRLRSKGIQVTVPHSADCIEPCLLVVYTAAVKEDNIELSRARELGLSIMTRAEFLGSIMKKFGYGIAIAGCHGKTTTTSMVSIMFQNAGFDPTITLGGELSAIHGNVRLGNSKYFITEACEYMESFLKFHPFVAAILNVEEDHLDYYRDLEHIKETFRKFIDIVPKEGYALLCADDENAMSLSAEARCNIITFGVENPADYKASNIRYSQLGLPSFDVCHKGTSLGRFSLNVPGIHNVLNALAAIAIAINAGIRPEVVAESLLEFTGTGRRFEVKGNIRNITVIDDYAHHPTEVKATLQAALQYPHKKIWCIFQPHTYTRTKTLFQDFAKAFYDADDVIITDIYAAREKDNGEVNARILVDEVNKNSGNAVYEQSFEAIAKMVAKRAQPGDIVFTMGAGDVYRLAPMLLKELSALDVKHP